MAVSALGSAIVLACFLSVMLLRHCRSRPSTRLLEEAVGHAVELQMRMMGSSAAGSAAISDPLLDADQELLVREEARLKAQESARKSSPSPQKRFYSRDPRSSARYQYDDSSRSRGSDGKSDHSSASSRHDHSVGGSCGVCGGDGRFVIEATDFIAGRPEDAARGINFYLRASDADVYEKMVHGVASIRREIADFGTEEDKECLDYILNAAAGSSDKVFANGKRDAGRNGERLADFVNHEHSRSSGLSEAHVLALRLYTSAAYKSINAPLRDLNRSKPHPFPVLVSLIADGLKRLRSVGGDKSSSRQQRTFWRGMRNLRVTDRFDVEGGTEVAPMSATSDLRIALRYAMSEHSLIFKITTKSFMERGVDLSYLSCFPEEAEFLFAPLTYLQPTGVKQIVEAEDSSITIVEVNPSWGS